MADVVRGQIAYADPEGPMKPNLVTGTDADDVALYVAKCSANPSCGVTAATDTPPAAGGGGGGGSAAPADGKKLFASDCASCHTLKDAGASGAVGPNLDTLKPPSSVVAHQVEVGGGGMPPFKGLLTPAEIKAVSDYVAKVAGK
jgi:cytochrome c553